MTANITMIKLQKPKMCLKTKEIIKPAHVKANINHELTVHDALIIGQRLIDLANAADKLNKKVTK